MDSTTGEPVSHAWRATSALDLEDLLDELRSRATAARSSQDRLAALLDAVVAISTDLSLSDVLARIVRAACRLVDARYGALGVLDADGEHLIEFITDGVTPDERAAIGDPPSGHGVLGLLITDPQPQRLRDIRSHPSSYGFPPNHPPMSSFLGVPVRIRDEVFGNLYMAEKIGAEEFSAEDEAVLVALAAAAGVAIDNARLYDLAQRRSGWSSLVSSMSQALLGSGDDDLDPLRLVADGARTNLDADSCGVLLAQEDGGLWLAAASPAREATLIEPDRVGDHASIMGAAPGDHTLAVPLSVGVEHLGDLVAVWSTPAAAPTGDQLRALEDFGRQVGLALGAARGRRDRSHMALLEDRDRIARDMHDHVIQRLFATGLSLQSAARLAQHPMVRERLDEAVDSLDVAIKDIRHAIFELHRTGPASGSAGDAERAIRAVVLEYVDALPKQPTLTLEGRISSLAGAVLADVFAVIREGLSNAVRHSGAASVEITVAVSAQVTVRVADDGSGIPADAARSGLANLARRAERRGGSLEITANHPTGTLLLWQVPRDVN